MKIHWIAPLLCLPMLVGGCATKVLWEEGRFATFHEPANPPNLAFHHASPQRRVLVSYDEANERNDHIRRRFYWVDLDHAPFENPHRPGFVPGSKQAGLQIVPVYSAAPAMAPAEATYAVIDNAQEFTLFTASQAHGPFELPVYRDSSGRVKQILLTPFTVAADATIVGGVLFVWWWSEGGLTEVH